MISEFSQVASLFFWAESKGLEPLSVLRPIPVFKTGSSSSRVLSIGVIDGNWTHIDGGEATTSLSHYSPARDTDKQSHFAEDRVFETHPFFNEPLA